jgi:hypothetical protein
MRVSLISLSLSVLMTLGGAAFGQTAIRQSGVALTLKVTDFSAAQVTLSQIATEAGGGLSDGRTYVTEKGRRYGWVRLRLPQTALPVALEKSRTIGVLVAESRTTDSWQAAHGELGIRADALQAHAGRLEKLLESNRRMRAGDILYLQERLFRASVDEELLRQRQTNLEAATRQSSVVITLFEPYPVRLRDRFAVDLASRFSGGMTTARERALASLGRVATGAGYILTYAPLWAPLLLLILGGLRLLWRRGGQALAAAVPGLLRTGMQRAYQLFLWAEQKRAGLATKYALTDDLAVGVDSTGDGELPAGAGRK